MHVATRSPDINWYCPGVHATHAKSESMLPGSLAETIKPAGQVAIGRHTSSFVALLH